MHILPCPLPSLRVAGPAGQGWTRCLVVNLPPGDSKLVALSFPCEKCCLRVKGQRPRQEEGQSQLVTLQGLQPLQMCPKGGVAFFFGNGRWRFSLKKSTQKKIVSLTRSSRGSSGRQTESMGNGVSRPGFGFCLFFLTV